MNILFICKYNRFRSKVAESIFNKLNKNPENKAKSAGLVSGIPISQDIFQDCKEAGFPISKIPQRINHKLLMWADIIIIVANNIPSSLFNEEEKNDNKKIIQWLIKDPEKEERKEAIRLIREKVEDLIKTQK